MHLVADMQHTESLHLTHTTESLKGTPHEGVILEAQSEVADGFSCVVQPSVTPPQQPEGDGSITAVVGSYVSLCTLLEAEKGLQSQYSSIRTRENK